MVTNTYSRDGPPGTHTRRTNSRAGRRRSHRLKLFPTSTVPGLTVALVALAKSGLQEKTRFRLARQKHGLPRPGAQPPLQRTEHQANHFLLLFPVVPKFSARTRASVLVVPISRVILSNSWLDPARRRSNLFPLFVVLCPALAPSYRLTVYYTAEIRALVLLFPW